MGITVSSFTDNADKWYENSIKLLNDYQAILESDPVMFSLLRMLCTMENSDHIDEENIDDYYEPLLTEIQTFFNESDHSTEEIKSVYDPSFQRLKYLIGKYGADFIHDYTNLFFGTM